MLGVSSCRCNAGLECVPSLKRKRHSLPSHPPHLKRVAWYCHSQTQRCITLVGFLKDDEFTYVYITNQQLSCLTPTLKSCIFRPGVTCCKHRMDASRYECGRWCHGSLGRHLQGIEICQVPSFSNERMQASIAVSRDFIAVSWQVHRCPKGVWDLGKFLVERFCSERFCSDIPFRQLFR